jgi:predicted nucleic acid-binding protein
MNAGQDGFRSSSSNILSALLRPAENQKLIECIRVQPAEVLHTSTVNIAEIRYGIELKQDPLQRADLTTWLDSVVSPLFEDRIHAVSEEVLLRWLFIIQEGKAKGHTYSHQDSLIAAVAAANQLVVMTADESQFVQAGVPTLNPGKSVYCDSRGHRRELAKLVSATLITRFDTAPSERNPKQQDDHQASKQIPGNDGVHMAVKRH